MSVAVFESTPNSAAFAIPQESTATQLVFDFEDKQFENEVLEAAEFEQDADVQIGQQEVVRAVPPVRRGLPEKAKRRGFGQPSQLDGQKRRVGSDVRIGAVMLQLLKSYGITDEEIEAGLESYARKNCSRKAS